MLRQVAVMSRKTTSTCQSAWFRRVMTNNYNSLASPRGPRRTINIGRHAGATATFTTWCPLLSGFDFNNQTVTLEDGSRANPFMAQQNSGKPMVSIFDDVRTVHDAFQHGLRLSQHGPCLGSRSGQKMDYDWLTYQQVNDRSKAFGSGLLHLGVAAPQESHVGIYSINRIEWFLTDRAASMFSLVTIPLYDSLGKESCCHIVNLSNMKVIVCDKEVRMKKLLDSASQMPSLKTIVAMETVSEELKKQAKACSVGIISFDDVVNLGEKNPAKPVPPKPSDIFTICFTSGTTGTPKGAMLTHANMVANFSSYQFLNKDSFTFPVQTRYISYLPLAHMFERVVQLLLYANGCSIGFYSGDIALLFQDMQRLKPTMFITVPRLINGIRDKVYDSVAGNIWKSFKLNLAVRQKTPLVKRGIVTRDTFWDKLVFKNIQNLLGGKLEFIISGSAPHSAETMNFFKCATGCMVVEGYGQTESVAATSSQVPGDNTGQHVGTPIACNYVKLIDVPELGYHSADNKGEICVKGTNVFLGYYKDPEKTAEILDDDGWLHSGDIGSWLPNGALKVIDRKKHIFKLSQGEFVAPERIELVYMRSSLVAQIYVDGDGTKDCLMGIVVPNQATMVEWAKQNGVSTDLLQLCASKEAKEAVLSNLLKEGKKADLKGYEQVKDILLWPEPFTVDNGLLTPTFKARRQQLREKFKSHIDNLYTVNNK